MKINENWVNNRGMRIHVIDSTTNVRGYISGHGISERGYDNVIKGIKKFLRNNSVNGGELDGIA